MKKSLSTILSLAMAFSMFSSVALGAEAAKDSSTFTDLKDLDAATKEKFDAMIKAGVFDGLEKDRFGLKEEMNRAQFAKVAALIFNLKVDTSLKTSSFKDVKPASEDPANGYALPYIEAVKAAGITDGYADGEYNPAGKVTKEQLATFLIRGLGKDSEGKATPGVNDSTVTEWARGYVALALQLKLMTNGTDGKFNGTSNATRDLLVLSSFEGKKQYQPKFDGKYAIASLEATNFDELTVKFNGAVTAEAEKALKFEVKRDGNVLSSGYTVKFSDDKTKAVLKFDTKFINSKYEVTISGVSNIEDSKKTASVTTTPEKITKIDFLTTSETIPLAVRRDGTEIHKVRIDFKATNQYGQRASANSGQFDIRLGGQGGSVVGVPDAQAVNLSQDKDTVRNDRYTITIRHNESNLQVQKTFVVGEEARVSKIELGDLLNSSGNKVDYIEANSIAYLDYKAYDQYGFRVDNKALLNKEVSVTTSDRDLDRGDEVNGRDAFVDSVIGDSGAELKLVSRGDQEKKITVSVSAGQLVTKEVQIKAAKIPATVEFGAYNYQLAENDAFTYDESVDDKFYVPIIVKDSKGQQLSADDIVKAAKNNDRRDSKFDIRDSGGVITDGIVLSGPHKGKIKIKEVNRQGSASISVRLTDYRNDQDKTLSFNVGASRKANEIRATTLPKKQMVPGTDNEVKFKIFDQYNNEMKYVSENERDFAYTIRLSITGQATNEVYLAETQKVNGVNKNIQYPGVTGSTYNKDGYVEYTLKKASQLNGQPEWDNFFDKSFKVWAKDGAPKGNTYTIRAELFSSDRGATAKSIHVATPTVEIINPKDTQHKFTYEVYLDKGVNNTILAGKDYLDLDKRYNDNDGKSVSAITYLKDNYNKVGHEVKVRVKNSSGEEVKTKAAIASVQSINPSVVGVVDNKVLYGLNAGSAQINVMYDDAEGNRKDGQLTINTKNEGPIIQSISLKKTGKTSVDRNQLIGKYMWDALLAEKITIKDQYGDEIVSEKSNNDRTQDGGYYDQFLVNTNTDPNAPQAIKDKNRNHSEILGVSFYVNEVTGTGKVEIDGKTSQIKSIEPGVTGFTLNAVAGGKSATFTVSVK